jgi:hypothetical protein
MRASKLNTFVKTLALLLPFGALAPIKFALGQETYPVTGTTRSAPVPNSQFIEVRLSPNPQLLKKNFPIYFGLVFDHPAFGDIPLGSGQLRSCTKEECSFQVSENNQTRRYLNENTPLRSYFAIEINDPDVIRKILEDEKQDQNKEKSSKMLGIAVTPKYGKKSLYLKETPSIYFDTGDPSDRFGFNDSKFSRNITWGTEYGLEVKSKYFVFGAEYYKNFLSTRGFFSNPEDPSVETTLSVLTLQLGLRQTFGDFDVELSAIHQRHDFQTSLTDDYSILSSAYRNWGLRASTAYGGIKYQAMFAPIIGITLSPIELRFDYSPFGNATDSGEFKRGTSGSYTYISTSVLSGFETISNRVWLNKFRFNIGYNYERSKTSFSGDRDYPAGYPDPSIFNEDSKSQGYQHGLIVLISRRIEL